ncbi:MAG: hopanoid-associated sugar epimerase [Syntrophobacteraceae bacterium]
MIQRERPGMSTAFITGATGFIGHHVARVLLEKGWSVRALRRANSEGPFVDCGDIEWRPGDIRDYDLVRRAMAGCNAVFHVAADYRLWAKNPRDIYESNVSGTENVLAAALSNRVDRVIYTGSVGALGLNRDGTPADESVPVTLNDMVGHYKRSKFLAERKAEEFVKRGLPLVIVNPSTPVGPGDHKPTPTGKIIVDFLNRKMPAYLDTGLNLIDVRDVAHGHLLALERGANGGKYILGCRNLTLAEIFQLLEKISGNPAPRFRLPYTPILILSLFNNLLSKITGREPLIPSEGVRMARKFMFFDASKALRELGLPQTPIEVALSDAVAWFRENGYCKLK